MSEDNSELEEKKCSICHRFSQSGAVDTCSHYAGVVWDGDLIWGQLEGEPGKRFAEPWVEVQAVWLARGEELKAREGIATRWDVA